LPTKEWASDRNRRRNVGVPHEISFKTKPEIALAQMIRWAREAGLPRDVVLMDAGYGGVPICARASLTALSLSYAPASSHTRPNGHLARDRVARS
jgi:SRSO17 transposase